MPDYEISLYVGEFAAARMTVERDTAIQARYEAERFISQCWEFDWAEVWRADKKLCKVRPTRPNVRTGKSSWAILRNDWTRPADGPTGGALTV
jgi:hypothetical protein